MPQYDQIFSTVETYDKLTIDYLQVRKRRDGAGWVHLTSSWLFLTPSFICCQYSKIGKVMRRIAGMENIPRDEEFQFKDRASKLVTTWQAIIQAAEAEAETSGKANGVAGKEEQPAVEVNGKPEASGDADMVNGDTVTPTANGVHDTTTEQKDDGEAAMDTSDS